MADRSDCCEMVSAGHEGDGAMWRGGHCPGAHGEAGCAGWEPTAVEALEPGHVDSLGGRMGEAAGSTPAGQTGGKRRAAGAGAGSNSVMATGRPEVAGRSRAPGSGWYWTQAERQNLAQAIRLHGTSNWGLLKRASGNLRTVKAMRRQYEAMRQAGEGPAATGALPTHRHGKLASAAGVESVRTWGMAGAQDAAEAELAMASRAGKLRVACPRACMGDVSSGAAPRSSDGRMAARPWWALLRASSGSAQLDTVEGEQWAARGERRHGWRGLGRVSVKLGRLQALYVVLWRLTDDGGNQGFMLCNFRRAEGLVLARVQRAHPNLTRAAAMQRVRRWRLTVVERDEMRLTIREGDASRLGTLRAARHSRAWVCGPAAGEGFWLPARFEAVLMAVPTRSPAFRAAEKILSEEELRSALGDAINVRFCEYVEAHLDAWVRSEVPRESTGTFYSGGIDAFAIAARNRAEARQEPHELVFAAELVEKRRRVMRAGHAPSEVHSTAEAAARMAPYAANVRSSPPCVYLTTGRRVSAQEREAHTARAAAEARHAMTVLHEYVARHAPVTIAIEQTVGMVTHYREVHAEVVDMALRLPYAWWQGVVDAGEELRASRTRRRVALAAVRIDALNAPVPKRCLGEWWTSGGGCACGAQLLRGACVVAECATNGGTEGSASADAIPLPRPTCPHQAQVFCADCGGVYCLHCDQSVPSQMWGPCTCLAAAARQRGRAAAGGIA